MEEKLRKTGIDVIGNVCWGTHLCLFYQAKEDLINILAPYFKAGLENNEFCMWVTSESLSEKEAKKALREAMSNFHRYLKRGQIEIVPYTEWYLKDGTFNLQRVLNAWIDKLNQALAKGYDGIRVTSNTAWLKKRDWKSFVDYEKEVNNAIDKYRMLAICTYPLDKCGASEVIDVMSHHQFALIKRQGNWELIESGEHKRAEERILHSENKYRMLVEQSPDGIFSVDLNGRILSANRAIYEKLGYTEEELLSMNIWDIVPTSYRQVFEERIKHILKGEHLNFPAEYEVYSKTGNRYWVEIRSTPLFRNGQVVGFQGIARDITERKQAEEALRESEAKCRALVEASSDGIISMNEKGKITFWNKAVEQMFGYQRAEILGKPVTMLMPKEYKERHREAVRSFMKKPRRLKRTIEVEALKKNGKRFPIELSFSSYKSGDTFTFIAIVRDITERKKAEKELKKSEEKYRSLFDNANDAILIADPSTGIILDANKASEKLMGLPREKLIGMHQTEIHPLEEAMRYAEIFKEHVKKGKAIQQDVYVQHQKGYRIPVDIRANVIQIGNKKVIQGVFRDIRERKKVEERERRHRNELETLFQTATLLNSGLDLDEVLEKIVDSISKVIGFHHCSLRLVDKDRNVLVTKVVRGVGKEYWKYRKIIPIGKHKYDLSGLTAMDGKPHYVRDLMTLDYPKEMKKNVIKKYNLKSYLCIPIKVEKEVLGVFSIMTQAYREFSEDEMRLLFTFAEQAAQAIIRARTLDLLKESEAKYRTLFEHTGTAMTIVEEDTTISLVNSQFEKLSGYSKEEIEGKMSWTKFVHKDDLERMKKYHYERRKKGRKVPKEYEFKFVDRNGNIKNIWLSIVMIPGTKKSVASLMDITERKQAEEELKEKSKELTYLSRQIIKVQEEERKRISLELHDEVGQALAAVGVNIETLKSSIPTSLEPLRKKLTETISLVNEITESVRRISHDLRPVMLDDLGLVPALRWYTNRFSKIAKIDVELQTNMAVERLSSESKILLYRAVQEALTNVLKHSKANKVKIQLKPNDKFVELRIEDNGVGFEVKRVLNTEKKNGGLGLLGMRERVKLVGGTLNIMSSPGKGTKLLVRVPY